MTGFSSSCGACKFLRRRCTIECIFAPYFNYEEAAIHFGAVHKVFGASNFSKLLLQLPDVQSRSDAAITVSYEALARMQNPVYGCVAHIFALQQQVACLKEEIQIISSEMMNVGVVSAANCAVLSNEMSGIRADCNDQQCLPMEPSRDLYVNETCYGYMEMECPGIEGSGLNAYLDAGFIEKLLQELSQDHYG